MRANTWLDRAALSIAVFGQAIPNFWLGLVLIVIFGVTLRWLPITGSDSLAHFILPTVTLAFTVMPSFMRLTRSGMLDVLDADYIRTARAKGLSLQRRSFNQARAQRDAARGIADRGFARFLAGRLGDRRDPFSRSTESEFRAFQSITRADFPVVQAIIVFISFAYIVLTFLSDVINAWLDPRIQVVVIVTLALDTRAAIEPLETRAPSPREIMRAARPAPCRFTDGEFLEFCSS